MYEAVEYGAVDRADIHRVPMADVLHRLKEMGDDIVKQVPGQTQYIVQHPIDKCASYII